MDDATTPARRRGRPHNDSVEPTQLARLTAGQSRKLLAIARDRGLTFRAALDAVAGDDIDAAYAEVAARRPAVAAELGGES